MGPSQEVKTCSGCKHFHLSHFESPCNDCYGVRVPLLPKWTPKAAPEPVPFRGLETAYDEPRPRRAVIHKLQPELDLGIDALKAPAILQDAADILKERGQSRDKGDSERSMATVVNIFNAAEGLNLTEEQGWKFMLCLKLGRMKGGKFHFDDYQDLVGYSALLAECAATNQLKGNT